MGAAVTPDILTSAKGLGGGFPIGAMLTTDEIAASLVVGTHGSTFGGNPMGCAVGLAALDIIANADTLQGVQQRHDQLISGLRTLNDKYDIFSDIRGQGLLLGCELKAQWAGRSRDLNAAALAHGLLCLVAGPDVLRLAPSLLIEDVDISEGLKRLDAALADLS